MQTTDFSTPSILKQEPEIIPAIIIIFFLPGSFHCSWVIHILQHKALVCEASIVLQIQKDYKKVSIWKACSVELYYSLRTSLHIF